MVSPIRFGLHVPLTLKDNRTRATYPELTVVVSGADAKAVREARLILQNAEAAWQKVNPDNQKLGQEDVIAPKTSGSPRESRYRLEQAPVYQSAYKVFNEAQAALHELYASITSKHANAVGLTSTDFISRQSKLAPVRPELIVHLAKTMNLPGLALLDDASIKAVLESQRLYPDRVKAFKELVGKLEIDPAKVIKPHQLSIISIDEFHQFVNGTLGRSGATLQERINTAVQERVKALETSQWIYFNPTTRTATGYAENTNNPLIITGAQARKLKSLHQDYTELQVKLDRLQELHAETQKSHLLRSMEGETGEDEKLYRANDSDYLDRRLKAIAFVKQNNERKLEQSRLAYLKYQEGLTQEQAYREYLAGVARQTSSGATTDKLSAKNTVSAPSNTTPVKVVATPVQKAVSKVAFWRGVQQWSQRPGVTQILRNGLVKPIASVMVTINQRRLKGLQQNEIASSKQGYFARSSNNHATPAQSFSPNGHVSIAPPKSPWGGN